MLLRAQVELMLSLTGLARRARTRLDKTRHDERGAIPAEVAYIAGLVILVLAVIVIITKATKDKASTIDLG